MSVEVKTWQTRCNDCNDVYGDYWDTEAEARAYDNDSGGQCVDCLLASQPRPQDVKALPVSH